MRSNKYFGTDGIRGKVGQFPIVPEFILKLGWAVGKVLSKCGSRNIIIGKDTRISGHMIKSVLGAGLSSSGVTSIFIGTIPTPAIAYFIRVFHAFGGVVVSASHNPFYDNGVKFFSIQGTKLSVDVERAIELELKNNNFVNCIQVMKRSKCVRIFDAARRYIEFCKGIFPSGLNLRGLKIILDCANGSAYCIAPYVLYELGASIICIGCQPDGVNINERCGATDTRKLQNLVLKEQANLGIAYDGDADRVIMVDHLGNKVDGDKILYIIARDRQRNSKLLGGVVGTQMTNMGLELAFKILGVPFVRSYVGDRNILARMQKNRWYVGGEHTGHIVLLDKTSTSDGIITCLEVLLVMINNQSSLYDLCKGVYLLPQVLFSVPFLFSENPLKSSIMKNIIQEVKSELGVFGRVLLRISGTEPYIRVMLEGECYNQITCLANKILNVLKTFK